MIPMPQDDLRPTLRAVARLSESGGVPKLAKIWFKLSAGIGRPAGMSKALSVDLRTRVLAAVVQGATHREAAARFGVSAASVSRWRSLQRDHGDVRSGPLGGDRRSGRIEAVAPLVLEVLSQTRDATIDELRRTLGKHGHWFGYGTL